MQEDSDILLAESPSKRFKREEPMETAPSLLKSFPEDIDPEEEESAQKI